jgi:hypothetical protein
VLALEEFDYAIEADEPLTTPAHRPPTDVSQEIGARVARQVPERATLQLGIGAVPDAVLAALHRRRGLAVWSEMFSDGVLALEKAGALDPSAPITASFMFGGQELYDWADRNERIRMLRTEKTNDPGLIARRPRGHRAALLASPRRCLDRHPPAGGAGDLVPAQLHRQRAGHRHHLGQRRRHPGPADHRPRSASRRARRTAP